MQTYRVSSRIQTRTRIGALVLAACLFGAGALAPATAGAATVDDARSAAPAPTSSECSLHLADQPGSSDQVGGVIASVRQPGSTGLDDSTAPWHGLYADLVDVWHKTLDAPAPTSC